MHVKLVVVDLIKVGEYIKNVFNFCFKQNAIQAWTVHFIKGLERMPKLGILDR